jgi:O-antigen ligase
VAVPFLPDGWFERMQSIKEFEQDGSAQGRFNAWKKGWNVFLNRSVFGDGFQTYTWRTFAMYSPNPDNVHDVHSIYFEILGEHDLPGAVILFGMIGSALLSLTKMKKQCNSLLKGYVGCRTL